VPIVNFLPSRFVTAFFLGRHGDGLLSKFVAFAKAALGLPFAMITRHRSVWTACKSSVQAGRARLRSTEDLLMPVATEPVVLWTLGQSNNAVQCVATNHPLGVELRYVMNNRMLMSRVFDSWDRLKGQAQVWREGLQLRGWVERPSFGRMRRA
jgi:hypothetical protein